MFWLRLDGFLCGVGEDSVRYLGTDPAAGLVGSPHRWLGLRSLKTSVSYREMSRIGKGIYLPCSGQAESKSTIHGVPR